MDRGTGETNETGEPRQAVSRFLLLTGKRQALRVGIVDENERLRQRLFIKKMIELADPGRLIEKNEGRGAFKRHSGAFVVGLD